METYGEFLLVVYANSTVSEVVARSTKNAHKQVIKSDSYELVSFLRLLHCLLAWIFASFAVVLARRSTLTKLNTTFLHAFLYSVECIR